MKMYFMVNSIVNMPLRVYILYTGHGLLPHGYFHGKRKKEGILWPGYLTPLGVDRDHFKSSLNFSTFKSASLRMFDKVFGCKIVPE
ncbi:hypothetical protein MBAV_001818 [Candidatus Magnetobacterium bavaricum]|uniref:Uncharacterized protein n=1 Tax=Candidatus Magnetobacterium bavaricum TaxID=29290 RepID=A0A0F3GVH6_9BACT|nr:hypothetical protein MBAV_001818 [Candidatus Magnetobacterium bavaricum]